MRNPIPIIATLFIAVLTLFLMLRQAPKRVIPPVEIKLPPILSVLGETPDWSKLNEFQHTITRSDFETLLRDIFTTDDTWRSEERRVGKECCR